MSSIFAATRHLKNVETTLRSFWVFATEVNTEGYPVANPSINVCTIVQSIIPKECGMDDKYVGEEFSFFVLMYFQDFPKSVDFLDVFGFEDLQTLDFRREQRGGDILEAPRPVLDAQLAAILERQVGVPLERQWDSYIL